MSLPKQWFFVLILIITVGASAGWSWLPDSSLAATATPTPAPTAATDEISSTPSPDGRWTAIVNSTAGSLDLQQPDGQIVTIFPPGSTVNTITWSPDSRHLLVVRTNWLPYQPDTAVQASAPIEIWQVEIEGDKTQPAKQIFQSNSTDFQAGGAEQIVFGHWSPNSRHVIFWVGILSASILADGLPLSLLDVTTGQVTQVAEVALLNPRYQSWAPDSSALAVTAGGYRSAQVGKWLTLFDVASGQVTTVISETEQIPGIVAWSPKGDLIAYAAVPADQTGDEWADLMTFDNPAIAGRRIYLLDPTTGQYHRLNEGETYQDAPLWSDDGTMLYYVERQDDVIQLMAANPTTGEAEPIAGASQPLDSDSPYPDVGYYGQSDWDTLLAYRPAGELAMAPAATEPVTPEPAPSADELELVRFIFKQHPPVLGTLTEDFLKTVETGQYRDFTVQEADLTDDGQPERVVSGSAENLYLFVAVVTRDEAGELRELFHTESIEGKYLAEVRATVQSQQVIADFLTATGGTGYLETTWEQRWIECQADSCTQVWSVPLLVADRSVTWMVSRNYTAAEIEQLDADTVQLTTRHFGLKDLPLNDMAAPPDTVRRIVGPDTLTVYRREGKGQDYQLDSQQQLMPGQEIAREFDLQNQETQQLVYEAISQAFYQADGSFDNNGFLEMQAELWGLPTPNQPDDPTWGSASRQLDIAAHNGLRGELGEWVAGVISALDSPQCRLTVLRHTNGKFEQAGRLDLPCTVNLTRLAWVDVTGDARDELLLLTLPPEVEVAGQVQRLHVYTTASNKLTELTTLDGFINGPDGIGIHWETTVEEFKVQAGLPLIDPDAFPSFSDIRLEREFQTYVWDEGSQGFKVIE